MNELKPVPLTSERIAEIERGVQTCRFSPDNWAEITIRDLLADRAFWRDAVREADFDYVESFCPFCDERTHERGIPKMRHKPDCAWLLAQDETLKGK